MDREKLIPLEKLNQLALTEEETERVLAAFAAMEAEEAQLAETDTSAVERMVFNIPLKNILREDAAEKNFTRDQLQEGAPEKMDGYWQVPRLVE
ncbi:MAG: Asp-tRNA(Asn)/Glu-tRNA(Gln) amidotransferase subunit GatC [Oscillospiraceae bacterium]|nr:Asp-tRNA(Asn)/Glu-tRNA(Gln) amidotransferase subunit GatC [Oscillospiraceae bacterium]